MTDLPDWMIDALNDRRPTAIHEAGHAVMACGRNISFRCVTIDPAVAEGRKGGVMNAARIIASREQAHDWMLFCLAGHAACEVEGVPSYGWLEDSDEALNRTAAIWWKDDNPQAAYDKAKACAVEIMRKSENREAVQRLAALLLERGTIYADDVRACIAQADDDMKR